MKNITIALPEIFVNNLEYLQENGVILSRSDGLRIAIRDFLKKESKIVQLLTKVDEKEAEY